ncbi:MAG TPA: MFS transporter [Ideonella sp.]|nr:MFS transporter [Ideonella sp.]
MTHAQSPAGDPSSTATLLPTSSPTPTAAPAALPSGAIACLSLGGFGSAVSLRVNDALLPRLGSEFGISLGQAAQVISVFAIAYGIAQLLFGPLGDRFGKYRVIAWVCVASAASALLCALAADFTMLVGARALAGIMAAAIIPLAMAWIGDVVPYEQRQPVLARFLLGQITGLAGGVWVGGLAADHLGWRVPYFALAVFFAAISVLLFAINRRLPAHARAMRRAEGSALRRMVSEFGQVLALPWARVLLATVFLEGMCLYGPFAFIATHLHQTFGLSLATAGSLVLLYGLGGASFALGSGVLVARLGEAGLARWGGALLAGSLLVIAFAPAWPWSIAGCLFAGLGFYMLHNTLQVNATQMAPERRGAAVSAFAACFFLGQSAGVAIAGLVVEQLGTAAAIGLGAGALVVIAMGFAQLRAGRDGVAARA